MTTSIDLHGQVSIVTGGSQGIGRAIAITLAAHGSDIVIIDIAQEAGNRTIEVLRSYGVRALFFQVDVTDEERINTTVSQILEQYGQVDILVNNAGITCYSRFMEISLDEWQKILNVNLTGAFLLCKAVVPAMLARRKGRIVMISSGSAITGTGGGAHYAASKGGMNSLTRSLAKELASSGILVNAVAPRSIHTDQLYELYSEGEFSTLVKRIPVGRLGTPEDIANVVLFLVSDLASFICGQIILVDGGRTYSG